jgi:hypothetical protein
MQGARFSIGTCWKINVRESLPPSRRIKTRTIDPIGEVVLGLTAGGIQFDEVKRMFAPGSN